MKNRCHLAGTGSGAVQTTVKSFSITGRRIFERYSYSATRRLFDGEQLTSCQKENGKTLFQLVVAFGSKLCARCRRFCVGVFFFLIRESKALRLQRMKSRDS